MANIALVAAEIHAIRTDPGHSEIYPVKCGETITAGQILCWDTDGTVLLADGNVAAEDEPQFVALQGGLDGDVISALHRGRVEGFTVSAINVGTRVTLTDTPGVIESAGAGECCGRVVAEAGAGTCDRVIHFDFAQCIAGIG